MGNLPPIQIHWADWDIIGKECLGFLVVDLLAMCSESVLPGDHTAVATEKTCPLVLAVPLETILKEIM